MANLRVPVEPALLRWACARNGRAPADYAERFHLKAWIARTEQPTLKQLEAFAGATSTPIGYFFLATPPTEALPIQDFRTTTGDAPRPSPELLDAVRDCQARQSWYHDFAVAAGHPRLPFVGSVTVKDDVVRVAASMRGQLGFDLAARRKMKSVDDAFSRLVEHVEDAGVLVMKSGIVGSNTHRKLEVDEFRGFTLVDERAPLVFVNGSDAKAAQIFTLAHELGHVWLGKAGVSDEQPDRFDGESIERWCNLLAAELLVPIDDLKREVPMKFDLDQELVRLMRLYRVSSLVVLRRLREIRRLDEGRFREAYAKAIAAARRSSGDSGGDFYRTLAVRVGNRFARALVTRTMEGHVLFRDAFRMLGVSNAGTFEKFATRLGVD